MELKKVSNAMILVIILTAVLVVGLAKMKYGRFNIYTVNYSELYMQLEWDNYEICQWIIPLR